VSFGIGLPILFENSWRTRERSGAKAVMNSKSLEVLMAAGDAEIKIADQD
jgi:hypothetical protein